LTGHERAAKIFFWSLRGKAVMDARTLTTLDFESLIELLARHVQTPLGRKRATTLLPSSDRAHIDRELDRTTECVNYFSTGGAFGLGEIEDPEESLAQLQVEGTSLDPHQLLGLQRLIGAGMDVRIQFSDAETKSRYPNLSSITERIPDLRKTLAAMRGKILPTGEIDDSASPALRKIRREINERRARIYRSLESLMHDRAPSAIQEDIVTIRNGRFVIPVRTDSRGQIPGVMHGLSSSGQTTYIEPLATIDQNNEMVRLREEEEIEIARILLEITEALRVNRAGIISIAEALAEIDFTQAKARLSAEFNCVRPTMTAGRALVLEGARHVLLEQTLKKTGSKVTPISLEMDEAHQTMVISGPNAGGKTVAVKTVGLLSLMAHAGLHVPASIAVLPVYDQVLADIGDQQSIAANLSTFTAHMRNIAEMAESVSPPALILLDEVGTGTDPDEGAALGVAIVDFFRRAGATTIATTHYNPLKTWASQAEGVLNASVEFDEETLRPTYRLIVGVAGSSSGLEIARRMNLRNEIIDEAKEWLSPAHIEASDYLKRLKKLVDEQETMRTALEEERQATADKYAKLDIEFAGREADRQREFEGQLAQVIRDFTAESDRLLNTVKDRATAARLKKESEARAAELRRSAAVRLRKQAASAPIASVPLAASPSTGEPTTEPIIEFESDAANIRQRDRVRIKSLGQEGTVESISDGKYTVLVGSLRFRLQRDEIQLIKAAAVPASNPATTLPRGVSAEVSVDSNFTPEINVIGSHVDEATDRVDKFLDEAFMAGAETVRIVHGHGTGALRRAIAELLTGHTHVVRFNAAPSDQGGSGATIATLQK
jgi:DNA mismatch repair protein MutS2